MTDPESLIDQIKQSAHEVAETMYFGDSDYPVKAIPYSKFLEVIHVFEATYRADLRASVVTEEPEWEYGSEAIEDDGDGPRPLSEDRDFWPDGITAHASEPDERKARQIIESWQNAKLVRRRKAGPWEVCDD